jgi:hypothetical protein
MPYAPSEGNWNKPTNQRTAGRCLLLGHTESIHKMAIGTEMKENGSGLIAVLSQRLLGGTEENNEK